jgi:hypothetical protein
MTPMCVLISTFFLLKLTIGYQVLKEQFKTHFRNVSQIMDCIGCDKCRLWGKVQITGLATALKILFEMDEKALECVFSLPVFFSLDS